MMGEYSDRVENVLRNGVEDGATEIIVREIEYGDAMVVEGENLDE